MPFVSEFGGAHDVFGGLCVLVVGEIVARHIVGHRVAIGHTENNLKHLVLDLAVEHRTMDGVVNCDSAEERKKGRDDAGEDDDGGGDLIEDVPCETCHGEVEAGEA